LAFLINSQVHPFLQKDPILVDCQVVLKQAEYSFLNHDSYLNCAKVFDDLEIDNVVDHLLENPRDFKGELRNEDVFEVIQAVKLAHTLSDYDKDIIIRSLGD
jgi:hypothetical protein